VPEEKVCAARGRRIWSDDRYCPGYGIAFGGAPRVDRKATLPGFEYHLRSRPWLGARASVGWSDRLGNHVGLIALAAHGMR